jgi:hypothetical protein
LVEVLHGTLVPDGAPATLAIIEFWFIATKRSRRFLSATIDMQFADAEKRVGFDPEVLEIAPRGHFTLHPTKKQVELTRSAQTGIQGGGGPATANLGFACDLKESTEKQDQTTVSGVIRLEGRSWGRKNAVRWVLMENATQKTGIPTHLRAPILLKREDGGLFNANVKIEVEADMKASLESKVQRLFGKVEKDDPVDFDPSAPPTSNACDLTDLANCGLKELSAIVMSTVQDEG